jgi:hypothetical protein
MIERIRLFVMYKIWFSVSQCKKIIIIIKCFYLQYAFSWEIKAIFMYRQTHHMYPLCNVDVKRTNHSCFILIMINNKTMREDKQVTEEDFNSTFFFIRCLVCRPCFLTSTFLTIGYRPNASLLWCRI